MSPANIGSRKTNDVLFKDVMDVGTYEQVSLSSMCVEILPVCTLNPSLTGREHNQNSSQYIFQGDEVAVCVAGK